MNFNPGNWCRMSLNKVYAAQFWLTCHFSPPARECECLLCPALLFSTAADDAQCITKFFSAQTDWYSGFSGSSMCMYLLFKSRVSPNFQWKSWLNPLEYRSKCCLALLRISQCQNILERTTGFYCLSTNLCRRECEPTKPAV